MMCFYSFNCPRQVVVYHSGLLHNTWRSIDSSVFLCSCLELRMMAEGRFASLPRSLHTHHSLAHSAHSALTGPSYSLGASDSSTCSSRRLQASLASSMDLLSSRPGWVEILKIGQAHSFIMHFLSYSPHINLQQVIQVIDFRTWTVISFISFPLLHSLCPGQGGSLSELPIASHQPVSIHGTLPRRKKGGNNLVQASYTWDHRANYTQPRLCGNPALTPEPVHQLMPSPLDQNMIDDFHGYR